MRTTIPTPAELEKLLLEERGLTEENKKDFLYPTYELGDVFLFSDMKKSVERIRAAIENKEEIGIYADYDCDGIPGAVVLTDFFEKIGYLEHVHVYIPDRHDEGYGLSELGINSLHEKNVTLIITVDLGITGIAQIADAQSRGIDVIVTDHHAPIGMSDIELPSAFAIVHPCKSTYQNTEPCGAAMAFYLVCGFLETYREEFGVAVGWEKWLLDLVGFATLSDMVPLTGDNRMLAGYGLAVMRKTRRKGLQILFLENKLSQMALTEQDLTFTVAPRLNAASRMDTPMLAFQLLRSTDDREATALVRTLETINAERKVLVARLVKEAHKSVSARELPAIVVVGNPEWRPAVLGLVATKLSETYKRSFFVWGNGGDGMIKGSCRMLDIHHAAHLMHALPEGMLLHAGGHQAAGGFSVTKEQIHFLEEALNAAIGGQYDGETEEAGAKAELSHPLAVPLAIATTRHLEIVRRFAPFGVGNPQPEFLFENVTINATKLFGKSEEHLECEISDATGSAIAFTFFVDEETKAKCFEGATVSLIGTLEAGWRGGVRIKIAKVV